MNLRKGIYAASLDPITYGHIDIIERSAPMFDGFIVAIGVNPDKKYMFSLDERIDMAKRSLRHIRNVQVTSFAGLLVDFAYEQKAQAIVKGVRDTTDFSYEQLLHQVGVSQKLGIETIALFARKDLEHVSSSVVKAIQKEQGFIHDYVPLYVKQCIEARISGQYIVGITGEIGVGKSYVGNLLVDLGREKDVDVHNIDMDVIGHKILGALTDPVYVEIRKKIGELFGKEILMPDGFVNRKALGGIVFKDEEKMKKLNEVMYMPMLMRLRKEMHGKKGIILLNAALLVEFGLMKFCNNNVVMVKTYYNTQTKRLRDRGLSVEQINHRLNSQYREDKKEDLCHHEIFRSGQGKFIVINNTHKTNVKNEIKKALNELIAYFGIKRGMSDERRYL